MGTRTGSSFGGVIRGAGDVAGIFVNAGAAGRLIILCLTFSTGDAPCGSPPDAPSI